MMSPSAHRYMAYLKPGQVANMVSRSVSQATKTATLANFELTSQS